MSARQVRAPRRQQQISQGLEFAMSGAGRADAAAASARLYSPEGLMITAPLRESGEKKKLREWKTSLSPSLVPVNDGKRS